MDLSITTIIFPFLFAISGLVAPRVIDNLTLDELDSMRQTLGLEGLNDETMLALKSLAEEILKESSQELRAILEKNPQRILTVAEQAEMTRLIMKELIEKRERYDAKVRSILGEYLTHTLSSIGRTLQKGFLGFGKTMESLWRRLLPANYPIPGPNREGRQLINDTLAENVFENSSTNSTGSETWWGNNPSNHLSLVEVVVVHILAFGVRTFVNFG